MGNIDQVLKVFFQYIDIIFLKGYNYKWTSLEYDTPGPPGPPGGFLFIYEKN
jgi:hypothetical protein